MSKNIETSFDDIFTVLEGLRDNPKKLVAHIEKLKTALGQKRSFSSEELHEMYKNLGGPNRNAAENVPQKLIDNLPFPVARLLHNTNQQINDIVYFLFLCDAMECFVRWRLGCMLAVVYDEREVLSDEIMSIFGKRMLKPSMGTWISAYEHVSKQIHNKKNQKLWCTKKLSDETKSLKVITKYRNKVAHGDIANAPIYLEEILPLVTKILENFNNKNIKTFINHSNKSYPANGNKIQSPTVQKTVKNYIEEDNQTSFVCVVKDGKKEIVLQMPCLFLVESEEDIPDDDMKKGFDPEDLFVVRSYISSEGDCLHENDGSVLEYTQINADLLYPEDKTRNLRNFIRLFKPKKPVNASEPWLALLGESSKERAIAWDVDRKIINAWKKENILFDQGANIACEQKPPAKKIEEYIKAHKKKQESLQRQNSGTILFFGGKSKRGKSSLLLSTMDKVDNKKLGSFVFAYRFPKFGYKTPQSLDDFFLQLRQAVVSWLRHYTSGEPEKNMVLSGHDLRFDTEQKIKLLCSKNNPNIPQISIVVDDVHSLFDPNKKEQEHLDILFKALKNYCDIGYYSFRKTGKEQGRVEGKRQVFCLCTGFSTSSNDQDLDDYMVLKKQQSSIDFLYSWFEQQNFLLPEFHNSENPSISLDEIPLQSDAYRIELERCKEIRDYLNCTKRYPSNSTQRGIHMPPINLYGIKRILFQENLLPQLTQALSGSGSHGIAYLENLREISKKNPAFIESVKNLLQSGALTIDDPIENQDILPPSSKHPHFHDTSALIPLVLCFMRRIDEPLTVTSLQILCGNDSEIQHNPKNDKFILQALYAMPRYVKKVTLQEVDEEGNISYGWKLIDSPKDVMEKKTEIQQKNNTNSQDDIEEDELAHTFAIVDQKIQFLKDKYANNEISEDLQLNSVIRNLLMPIHQTHVPNDPTEAIEERDNTATQTIPTISGQNIFKEVYRGLRGALPPRIRSTLETYGDQSDVLRSSASMLYQCNDVAAAQSIWLQKAWESLNLQKQAQSFVEEVGFRNFWLRHENPERQKEYKHKINQIATPLRIRSAIAMENGFYIILGKTESKQSNKIASISVYHKSKFKPEFTINLIEKQANNCLWIKGEDSISYIVYDCGNELYIQEISFSKISSTKESVKIYDYESEILNFAKYSDNEISVYGKEISKKHVVDIIPIVGHEEKHTEHHDKKGKYIELSASPSFGHDRKGIHYIRLDGANGIAKVDIKKQTHSVKFAPKDIISTQEDMCCITWKSRPNSEFSWLSISRDKHVQCGVLEKAKKENEEDVPTKTFPRIIFAENISKDYLLCIDFRGTLRVYKWDDSTCDKDELLLPIVEEKLQIPEDVRTHSRGLLGGFLHDSYIVLYGVESYLGLYSCDVKKTEKELAKIKEPTVSQLKSFQLIVEPDLHFGTISGAEVVESDLSSIFDKKFGKEKDTFITFSEDNDLRLWSFEKMKEDKKKEDKKNNTLGCIGLFRSHEAVVKSVVIMDKTVVSMDEKQNICVWEINKGCKEQLASMDPQLPYFCNNAFVYENQICATGTKKSAYVDMYDLEGKSIWTRESAYKKQIKNTNAKKRKNQWHIPAKSIKKVYDLENFIIFQYDSKKIAILDIKANKKLASLEFHSDDTKSVALTDVTASDIRRYPEGFLVYNDSEIYQIALKDQTLAIEKHIVASKEAKEKITAVTYGKNDVIYGVTVGKTGKYRIYCGSRVLLEYLIEKAKDKKITIPTKIEDSIEIEDSMVDIEHDIRVVHPPKTDAGKYIVYYGEDNKISLSEKDFQEMTKLDSKAYQIPTIIRKSTITIKGISYQDTNSDKAEFDNGYLLFSLAEDNLEGYFYHESEKQLMPVPSHVALRKNPREFQKLPRGEKFTFLSGDTIWRWILEYDYPVVLSPSTDKNTENETEEIQKKLLLQPVLAWEYAQQNTHQLATYKRQQKLQTTVGEHDIFIEKTQYGILLHYKRKDKDLGHTLTWTGNSLRDFHLGSIRDVDGKGKIILRKNRDVIILQLMKGSTPVSFSELISSADNS